MSKQLILVACLTLRVICIVQAAKTVKQCEKQLPASLKSKLCDIRQYKNVDGPDMDKHMDCVMKALEFVDATGRGDFQKLYKPMTAVDADSRKHNVNIETCQGKTWRLERTVKAHEFYKCLLQSSSADAFKKVFDLTELVKAGKLPSTETYSAKVEKMIKKIDAKVCK
uniref:D7 short form salivary protein n=1 Tax=Anopheles farauti TaxID=69004 RepID=A0A182PZH1_9DIPT